MGRKSGRGSGSRQISKRGIPLRKRENIRDVTRKGRGVIVRQGLQRTGEMYTVDVDFGRVKGTYDPKEPGTQNNRWVKNGGTTRLEGSTVREAACSQLRESQKGPPAL